MKQGSSFCFGMLKSPKPRHFMSHSWYLCISCTRPRREKQIFSLPKRSYCLTTNRTNRPCSLFFLLTRRAGCLMTKSHLLISLCCVYAFSPHPKIIFITQKEGGGEGWGLGGGVGQGGKKNQQTKAPTG